MRKILHHIAVDAAGNIVATHNPTPDGRNPLVAPEGGSLRSLTAEEVVALKTTSDPRARISAAIQNPKSKIQNLRDLIRAARWKIADEATKVRDRKIKGSEFAPLKGAELARQMDIAVLFAAGRLKPRDKVLVTNWSDGTMNKTEVRVSEWLDAIERGFRLRQEIRHRELDARAKLAAIYRDPEKSDDEKITAIEALDIAEHLGLDETSAVEVVKSVG